MLKRVFGTTNGLDINFARTEEGKWETTIPRDASGVYYLELYAEDEAGNLGYMATVVMKFDPVSFCVEFKVLDFQGNTEIKNFIDVLQMKSGYETVFKGADDKCCY